MCDTILVPTDGSPGTSHVLTHAVELADSFDATLHGLYVLDAGESGLGGGVEVGRIREGLVMSVVADVVRDEIEGLGTDAATVVHYTAGTILDGDELDRQITAVVETATAVDDAEGVQSKE